MNLNNKIPSFMNIDDVVDGAMRETFGLSQAEWEYILYESADEDMDAILDAIPYNQKSTFSQKRKAIEIIRKYKNLYNENISNSSTQNG